MLQGLNMIICISHMLDNRHLIKNSSLKSVFIQAIALFFLKKRASYRVYSVPLSLHAFLLLLSTTMWILILLFSVFIILGFSNQRLKQNPSWLSQLSCYLEVIFVTSINSRKRRIPHQNVFLSSNTHDGICW